MIDRSRVRTTLSRAADPTTAHTVERVTAQLQPARKPRRWNKNTLKRNLTFLLMCAPFLATLFIFSYIPMYGVIIAFKFYQSYKGIWGSDWVGLQNFQFLFSGNSEAWRITYNTVMMNAIFIILGTIGSLLIALLLNEIRDGSRVLVKFYQSSLFVPYLISWVLVNFFVTAILDTDSGLLNHFLANFGIAPIHWYLSPQYWPLILTLVYLWKGAGFGSLIYLAGILGINPEYFEAATIDGANKWQQLWYITLPLLKPVLIINLLLSIGGIFRADFGLFFIVTHNSSVLYSTTDVIDTFVYRSLISLGDMGMSSAAGLYQSAVGFALVLLSNWLVKRADRERSLF